MIVFLWWSLTVAASIAVGASGHGIYAKWRTRVVAEEARIDPVWLTEPAPQLVAQPRPPTAGYRPRHGIAVGEITEQFERIVTRLAYEMEEAT